MHGVAKPKLLYISGEWMTKASTTAVKSTYNDFLFFFWSEIEVDFSKQLHGAPAADMAGWMATTLTAAAVAALVNCICA